jgi:glycosyltransferase involved in cell wall biosynthesis
VHPWQEAAWASTIGACDVAVIPIDLGDPMTVGKPENKLLLFWRIGMPVVTSATPAYRRAMDAAGAKYYCTTEADWTRALGALGADEGKRREAGLGGLRYAEEHASAAQHLAAWDRVFASLGF